MQKLKSRLKELLRRPRWRQEGQSLVIIAAAMIGLIAFVGLVTDVALVYVQYGHLRRAVDAAAVAAAGQMREGRYITEIANAATQTLTFHNLDPQEVNVFVPPYLDPDDPAGHYTEVCQDGILDNLLQWEDPDLCSSPPRKFVRVEARAMVNLAFLNIIGLHQIPLQTEAEGEAATLDVALVLDRSWSMAWDTSGCRDGDGNVLPLPCETITFACNATNPTISCQPMAQVLDAALGFMYRLQEPFDRAAIVTFDRWATTVVTMTTQIEDEVLAVLEGDTQKITVYDGEINCQRPVGAGGEGKEIWECGNTNLGAGLAYANNQFTHPLYRRDESVWVMIVLSDGGTNAALGVEDYCETDESCCPGDTRYAPDAPPYCRDGSADTRQCGAEYEEDCKPGGLADPNDWPAGWTYAPTEYDSDDFARDMADFAGLGQPDGNSIVIFSIGLGGDVTEYSQGGDPDAGEQVLRYVANVGYNGKFNEGAGDLCNVDVYGEDEVGLGKNCGNYYHAPKASELEQVFASIASRIFTRITR